LGAFPLEPVAKHLHLGKVDEMMKAHGGLMMVRHMTVYAELC